MRTQCFFRYLIGTSERVSFSKTPKYFTTFLHPQPNLDRSMDTAAYTQLLQSATSSQSLIHGKEVHAHMIRAHSKPCLFLQNNLLNMYCKCGDMTIARQLFDRLPKRDTVSWNSFISGYIQTGQTDRAVNVFMEARNANVKIDRFTYGTVLGICSHSGDLKLGKVIHGLVVVGGFHQHAFLTNSLIDMYSKCRKIDEARRVFDNAAELDDVSWNSLISAYVRIGLAEDTLRIFSQMHQLGMKMNSFALGSVLKSCSSLKISQEVGEMIHGCVVKVGLDFDVFVGSAMIDLYAKSGALNSAVKVFKLMPDPNVVVFNAMIAGFCRMEVEIENELTSDALGLFSEMQRRGMKPSKFTFSSVLRACNLANAFEFGKQIHSQVLKNSLQSDEFIGSALIDLYSNSGSIEEGFRCFHSVPKQDIVTWTSMISGCVQNEHFEKALRLFHELLSIGRKPDQFTISSVMSACANLAMVRSGEQIQSYAIKVGFDRLTICGNSRIFMYARSGDVDAAGKTFQEMENRDVVSWSAMISTHAQHGCARDAMMLFKEMEDCMVAPNHITFLGVLTACSHGGLVDEGFRFFESMKRDYGLNPNVKHCACIVDLLGRAGRLADAEDFILNSGFDYDPVMWRALLGSCRIHRDIERGACVAKRIMELEPDASASYVILYNMYLDAGRQSLATNMRDLMKERGVKKEPGLSWIEIGASIHSFVAGDKSHPWSHAIYARLEEMLSKVDKIGYAKTETLGFNDPSPVESQNLMNCHSEKLAVALGMIVLPEAAPIRVMKNLRVCQDCHTTMKLFSESERREIVLRDPIRFHHFRGGLCSCRDYW
ncbi:pentatricopeptide repeat-containing protein At3g13880 [Phoenix dactylifera]|uniref:Pentatricopeptide repeat-containing protein At3g13880 n=1 Tax=Phoenix dactylifera TaxID=42345 RepID=A0A8B7BW03_PHODC|nr:pentatricopeptide repeat-containing protein At3g13880 [Phoenix dactylifera]